jgi:hypothetical protein
MLRLDLRLMHHNIRAWLVDKDTGQHCCTFFFFLAGEEPSPSSVQWNSQCNITPWPLPILFDGDGNSRCSIFAITIVIIMSSSSSPSTSMTSGVARLER